MKDITPTSSDAAIDLNSAEPRRPSRHSLKRPRSKRCGSPRTAGIPGIRTASRSLTRLTPCGVTAPNFLAAARRIVEFLRRKWGRNSITVSSKNSGRFGGVRIAVRFAYEWHDDSAIGFALTATKIGSLTRKGLMRRRYACINDLPIKEVDRKFRWDAPLPRPLDHPGLTDLGM